MASACSSVTARITSFWVAWPLKVGPWLGSGLAPGFGAGAGASSVPRTWTFWRRADAFTVTGSSGSGGALYGALFGGWTWTTGMAFVSSVMTTSTQSPA